MKKVLLLALTFVLSLGLFAQKTWKKLAAGTEFSAGIQSDGSLWAWGSNLNGELGQGSIAPYPTPVQVGSEANWKTLSTGAFHVIAVKEDGTLWAWGNNSVNQLGNGNTDDQLTPIQIGSDTDWEFV